MKWYYDAFIFLTVRNFLFPEVETKYSDYPKIDYWSKDSAIFATNKRVRNIGRTYWIYSLGDKSISETRGFLRLMAANKAAEYVHRITCSPNHLIQIVKAFPNVRELHLYLTQEGVVDQPALNPETFALYWERLLSLRITINQSCTKKIRLLVPETSLEHLKIDVGNKDVLKIEGMTENVFTKLSFLYVRSSEWNDIFEFRYPQIRKVLFEDCNESYTKKVIDCQILNKCDDMTISMNSLYPFTLKNPPTSCMDFRHYNDLKNMELSGYPFKELLLPKNLHSLSIVTASFSTGPIHNCVHITSSPYLKRVEIMNLHGGKTEIYGFNCLLNETLQELWLDNVKFNGDLDLSRIKYPVFHQKYFYITSSIFTSITLPNALLGSELEDILVILDENTYSLLNSEDLDILVDQARARISE